MARLTQTRPSWVMPGALYDYDFANNRYWGESIWIGSSLTANGRAQSLGTWTNSGVDSRFFFTRDTDGIWKPATTIASQTYWIRLNGYGLWSEGYRNDGNYVLHCRDLTNAAWVISNTTDLSVTKTGIVGADASTGEATQITCNVGNGTITQLVSGLASDTYTVSFLMKRITGSGVVSITMDGSSYTDITSSLTSTGFTQVTIPYATTTSVTIGIKMATISDVIVADFSKIEDNPVATSPILTTTAARLRGIEGFYFNSASALETSGKNAGRLWWKNIFNGGPATILAQYSGTFDPIHNHNVVGDENGSFQIFTTNLGAGNIRLIGNGGSLNSSNTETAGLFTLNKVCCRLDGAGAAIALNGVLTTASTPKCASPGTATNATNHGQMMNNGSGTLPMNGYIKRVTGWNRGLPNATMVSYSTVINNN